MNRFLTALLFPCYSMLHRLAKGEGGLFYLTSFIVLITNGFNIKALQKILFALLSLAITYSFNDIHDAKADIKDSKRKNLWVLSATKNQSYFYAINTITLITSIIAYYIFIHINNISYLVLMLPVSLGYSFFAKKIIGLDLFYVFLWAYCYLYSFVEDLEPSIGVAIGLLVSMNHLYQLNRDKVIDRKNNIATLSNRTQRLNSVILITLIFLLSLVFFLENKTLCSIISFTLLIPWFINQFSMKSWHLFRFIGGFIWILYYREALFNLIKLL